MWTLLLFGSGAHAAAPARVLPLLTTHDGLGMKLALAAVLWLLLVYVRRHRPRRRVIFDY